MKNNIVKQMDRLPTQIPDLVIPERNSGYIKGRATRELILRAALGILTNEGYGAMSMRRVAAACGMKFGNLTYHYRTREDLVRELLDAVIGSYELEFDVILHEPDIDPEERLARYCVLVLDDIPCKKTTLLFPELWALSNHDAFVHERLHELYARARKPLLMIVAEMRPDLSHQDHEALALFISCSMEGATIFAGYEKPFCNQMSIIKSISIQSFTDIVKHFRRR